LAPPTSFGFAAGASPFLAETVSRRSVLDKVSLTFVFLCFSQYGRIPANFQEDLSKPNRIHPMPLPNVVNFAVEFKAASGLFRVVDGVTMSIGLRDALDPRLKKG
jgi:hypothetical protein